MFISSCCVTGVKNKGIEEMNSNKYSNVFVFLCVYLFAGDMYVFVQYTKQSFCKDEISLPDSYEQSVQSIQPARFHFLLLLSLLRIIILMVY